MSDPGPPPTDHGEAGSECHVLRDCKGLRCMLTSPARTPTTTRCSPSCSTPTPATANGAASPAAHGAVRASWKPTRATTTPRCRRYLTGCGIVVRIARRGSMTRPCRRLLPPVVSELVDANGRVYRERVGAASRPRRCRARPVKRCPDQALQRLVGSGEIEVVRVAPVRQHDHDPEGFSSSPSPEASPCTRCSHRPSGPRTRSRTSPATS